MWRFMRIMRGANMYDLTVAFVLFWTPCYKENFPAALEVLKQYWNQTELKIHPAEKIWMGNGMRCKPWTFASGSDLLSLPADFFFFFFTEWTSLSLVSQ